ncbi:MAG: hypothetical protein AAFY70_09425, partial [Bacteroidota bacterium]
MWDVIVAALGTVEFWQFASIPLISALVGWGTNVLAIKMTFYPLNFWGIKPLGWQGIIPSKAGEMAGKAVDLLTEKLITIEERFDQIEPERVAEEMVMSFSVNKSTAFPAISPALEGMIPCQPKG